MRAEEAYSVDGLDPLCVWGGVVAHSLNDHAQRCEPIYSQFSIEVNRFRDGHIEAAERTVIMTDSLKSISPAITSASTTSD